MVVACAAYAAGSLRVTTSITKFVIDPDDAELGPWIGRLAVTEPARTMVVTFAGDSFAGARAGARRFAEALAEHPEVEAIRTGPDDALGERLYRALAARRFRFVARDPAAIPARFSDEALARDALRLRDELARPTGAGIRRLAPQDPWLLFLDRTAALRRGAGDGLEVRDGYFATPGEEVAVVLLTTRHGPFEAAHQGPLDDAIEAERAGIAAELGVTLERSALHRFAVQSERTIRAEVTWLSALSGGGVCLLLLLAFRHLGALVLALVPMVAGVVVATAVTMAAFGEIHGLTLAFGTTLVGVCVDYPVHLMTHRRVVGDRDAALAAVWPALVLGAATTVAGFGALAVFGLPGVREMGLFAAIGVAVALGATRWLVAPWLPAPRGTAGEPLAGPRTVVILERVLDRLTAWRRPVAVIAVVGLCVAFVGWSRAHWVDDARALNSSLPAVSDEDARVRARVGGNDVGQVLIAQGPTLDAAAAVQDRLWDRLGEPALRSSAPLLWSVARQDANLAAVRAVPELATRTRAALAAAGFRTEPFAELDVTGRDDPGPLDHDAVVAAGLEALVRPFVVTTEDGVALLSFPDGGDAAVFEAAAAATEGAVWFDQRQFTAELYREHRRGSVVAVVLGLLVVVVVLGVRYRSAALVAAALGPALLAVAAAMGILAWCRVELQLLHLIGCMLTLCMGADYGVFLVETRDRPRTRPVAALGIAVACATTVLAFGVLGSSSNPALAAIGATTALGVGIAALLAPVALVLVRPQPVAGGAR